MRGCGFCRLRLVPQVRRVDPGRESLNGSSAARVSGPRGGSAPSSCREPRALSAACRRRDARGEPIRLAGGPWRRRSRSSGRT
jgi:hypothetical protein